MLFVLGSEQKGGSSRHYHVNSFPKILIFKLFINLNMVLANIETESLYPLKRIEIVGWIYRIYIGI